jgi:predicted ATP-grasp superfamily ATP-dependent carboligase
MGDVMAEFMSKTKIVLGRLTHIQVPDVDSFMQGYDKNKLMKLCKEKGYPHPLTFDLSEIDYRDAPEIVSFPYPGLIKPNCTTGGRGMVLINNFDELCKVYPAIREEYGDCHLQKFVREGGRQIKIQLYVDENSELVASSVLNKVRWYPIKGGASCCSVTIKDEKMVNICHQILKDIHWIGFADFDSIEDPDTGELLIMEINPRLPACIGASVNAGINWGEILVRGALGLEQKKYVYKDGTVLRHLGFDVLWFLHSPNRFKTKPTWFRFIGKKVFYQDFQFYDQKPFWVGTYHNFKKLFDPSFKKAKSGTSAI